MERLLGNGPDAGPDVELLQRKIERLEGDLRDARDALQECRESAARISRAQAKLKQRLAPWRDLILGIWGELEDVQADEAPAQAQDRRVLDAWEKWKRKVPGKPAEFIDALLDHGPMTVQQLVVATQTPRKQTIYDGMFKLSKLNLVEKKGDRYALREL